MNSTSVSVTDEGGYAVLLYVVPLIVVTGTIGHILTVIVMNRRVFSQLSVSIYLQVLALSDLCLLWMTDPFFDWVHSVSGVSIPTYNGVVCRIQIWLQLSLPWISSWLIVAVSIERVIAVHWPHQAKVLCTRQRALCVSLGIVFMFCAVNSHVITTVDIVTFDTVQYCTWIDQFVHIILGTLAILLYSVLPILLIVTCNILLIRNLNRHKRSTSMDSLSSQSSMMRNQRNNNVVRMLIVNSFAFIVLTLPINVLVTVNLSSNINIPLPVLLTANTMALTNHACNFVLYTLSGSIFREELQRMCTCTNDQPVSSPGQSQNEMPSSGQGQVEISRF